MADVEAIESVPLDARELPASTYEALRRGSLIQPDKPALSFFLQTEDFRRPVQFTFRQLFGRITQTANMFYDLGIRPGRVVSMLLPNLPEAHFTIWGGEAAGIVNPINPLLEPEVMADIMRAAETEILVAMGPFPGTDIWQKALEAAAGVPTLKRILRVDLHTYVQGPKKWAAAFLAWKEGRRYTAPVPVLDFNRLVKRYPADRLVSGRVIGPNEIAAYFHTGGTTGTPKLAQHTHFNEVSDAFSASQFLDLDVDKTMFCGLPLFHVNAVIVTGLIPWMYGVHVVLSPPQGYRAPGLFQNFWKMVEHYRINFFSGVPTVYSALLQVPIDADVSSLEYAICGAAPMPVEVFKEFEQRTGIKILEGYGLTEGTCVSSVNPPAGERRIGSIGFRIPYQDMKVVEVDERGQYVRDCETDEIGLIVIKGPNVFPGYKEDIHNQRAWVVDPSGEKWLNTGDLGRQDADGYFWITGRRKELIIRGGHNIDPKLIEDPMHKHPAVALAAAVGRPDPHSGEVPVVYVQLVPDAKTTEEELLAWARKHVGERAAVPKRVYIVDQMPVTAVCKIFKPVLVRREVADVYRGEILKVPGVKEATVEVTPDKKSGMKAHIRVTVDSSADVQEVEKEIRRVLGQYTVPYELMVS